MVTCLFLVLAGGSGVSEGETGAGADCIRVSEQPAEAVGGVGEHHSGQSSVSVRC